MSLPTEPQSFHDTVQSFHLRAAVATKFDALEQNNTWTLVDLLKGKRLIGCRWVYKVKYKSDGCIERYKAHFVAKGYK